MKITVPLLIASVLSPLAHAADLTVRADSNLREGPAVSHGVVDTLTQGTTVTPLRIERNYVEVRLADGERKGWLYFPDQGWSEAQVRAELPASAQAARPAPDIAWTSLEELGLRGGVLFEGLQSGHQQRVGFTLPRTAAIRGAKLKVGFTSAQGLNEHSILRIDVNGEPVYSTPLPSSSGERWIEIPLPARLLAADRRGSVDVVLRASLLASKDRCMDDRATASFLHVDAGSGLELDVAPGADGVLAAWELLPKRVSLSLPAQPDEAAFTAALTLVRQLQRQGKEVTLARLPRVGDIVVAPVDALRTTVADLPGGIQALESVRASDNVHVLELTARRVLVFSPSSSEWPVGLSDSGWMPAARSNGHDVVRATSLHDRNQAATQDEMSFDLLGADTSPREVARRAEWRIPLGVDRIPAGRAPTRIRLAVTSAPVPESNPMMLYAYLNDELQDVRRLEGGTEQFTLHFAPSATRGAFNALRLVAQRDPDEGDCGLPLGQYPIQISGGSSIVFEAADGAARDFGDMPRYFAGGYDLLLGREMLVQPEATIVFVANLLNANQYPLSPERVRFVTEMPAAGGPFLLVSEQASGLTDPAVRFDQGRVMVKRQDGTTLLDMDRLTGITVAQLVERDGARGLWVRPPASGVLPATETLGLTFDTVAFIDDRGVALTLSPEQIDIARISYPEYRDWFDLFGAYRYWLMALGWILVVALLAQLYVKVRSHKKTS